MEIICAHCDKAITVKEIGVVREGKAYHRSCWEDMESGEVDEDFRTLQTTFSNDLLSHAKIDKDTLKELYESYNNDLEAVTSLLKSNWCAITTDPDALEANADGFRTKKEMLDWITGEVHLSMQEVYGWDVLYILHKGEVVRRSGDIKIKVSI